MRRFAAVILTSSRAPARSSPSSCLMKGFRAPYWRVATEAPPHDGRVRDVDGVIDRFKMFSWFEGLLSCFGPSGPPRPAVRR